MPRSTRCEPRPKGQWFLISAVLISYALVSIFSVMNSYSEGKYYWGLINKAGYTIRNVENYLNQTTQMSSTDDDILWAIDNLQNMLANEGIYSNITFSRNGNEVTYFVNVTNSKFSVHRVMKFP